MRQTTDSTNCGQTDVWCLLVNVKTGHDTVYLPLKYRYLLLKIYFVQKVKNRGKTYLAREKETTFDNECLCAVACKL